MLHRFSEPGFSVGQSLTKAYGCAFFSLETLVRAILISAAVLAAGPVAAQAPAAAPQAQVNAIDKRVGTLEGQMRAVQRQVFPGGDKRFFAPEVVPSDAPPAVQPGSPATSPLADLIQRVDRMEAQQRALTGQVEQLQFQLRQLEQQLAKTRGDTEFRLNAIEGKAVAPPVAEVLPAAPAPALPKPAVAKPGAPAAKPVEEGAKPALAKPATPSPAPAAGAGDPVEASYRAAYALYDAGDFAGAEKALTAFVAANPKHSRASYAQFWAGRSLMQQGQHAQAAKAFLSGYQTYPRGDRAPNSLLWLSKALVAMKQPKAACQALDQLRTAYPDKLVGQLGADAASVRAEAKCGA